MKKVNLKTPNAEHLKDMTLAELLDTKHLFVLEQDFETASEIRDWERKMTGYKPPKVKKVKPYTLITAAVKDIEKSFGILLRIGWIVKDPKVLNK